MRGLIACNRGNRERSRKSLRALPPSKDARCRTVCAAWVAGCGGEIDEVTAMGALGGWNRGVPGVADWDPGPKNHFTGRLVLPLR